MEIKNNSNKENKKTINLKTAIIIALIIVFLLGLIIGNLFSIYKYSNHNELFKCNMKKNIYNKKTITNINQRNDKPIIYLYPTEEMDISVKLINPDRLTCSYPKYINGWNVHAKPSGDLKEIASGKNLYSLYYESKVENKFDINDEGFIIKGEDSAKFLEEKLAILGLTEREIEEFIVYWLPKLESNKYNYIRFATEDEINNNMAMEISPKPNTIIRVLMIFKGMNNPIEVEEQKLDIKKREGYTVVEWGGTEIK